MLCVKVVTNSKSSALRNENRNEMNVIVVKEAIKVVTFNSENMLRSINLFYGIFYSLQNAVFFIPSCLKDV